MPRPHPIALALAGAALACLIAPAEAVSVKDANHRSESWYRGKEARRLADTILLYQRENGGWPKNIDYDRKIGSEERAEIEAEKPKNDTTFDNGATWQEIRFLSGMFAVTGDDDCRRAALWGIDFVLEAQYKSGGFPQCYPFPSGYQKHITFNDNAMVGVLALLRDVSVPTGRFTFVPEKVRERAGKAVDQGIRCILKCQVKVDGELTAWGQQHDRDTYEPMPARGFEPASLCAMESADILEFLLKIKDPPGEVKRSIRAAAKWLDGPAKIIGRRYDKKSAKLKKDRRAGPLWARLYEIGSNKPIYGDHDKKIHYDIAEISDERRNGYSWLGTWGEEALEKYREWERRN
ncbi:MAG: pectate lyase [Verrucomicrobiales bacterium]